MQQLYKIPFKYEYLKIKKKNNCDQLKQNIAKEVLVTHTPHLNSLAILILQI